MKWNPIPYGGMDQYSFDQKKAMAEGSFYENVEKIAETEIVKQRRKVTYALASNVSGQEAVADIGNVIDCSRFHSKIKLLRVTAFVIRFIRKLKERIQKNELESGDLKELSALEIQSAEER